MAEETKKLGCGGVILLLGLIAIGVGLGQQDGTQPQSSSRSYEPDRTRALTALEARAHDRLVSLKASPALACASKEVLAKVAGIQRSGDDLAFKKVFALSVGSGICRIVGKDDPFYVTDTDSWGGQMKIRPKGGIEEFWMSLRKELAQVP